MPRPKFASIAVPREKALTMLELTHPWLLLIFLAIPPMVWLWQRRRGNALRFPVGETLAQLPAGNDRRRRWIGSALAALGLGSLVMALAGPRWPDLRTRIPAQGISIAMVVDVSGSMAE